MANEICFTKGWYGSVHENSSVCSVSQTPIQRIGLTNCSQTQHLCFAPPKLCIPCFGDLSDTENRLKNDSLYFVFDFPSSSGDLYTLEKFNQTTQVWSQVAVLDNTQGVKYTFGDAIFNDKYPNRSGYRLDSHLVIGLYGEGEYRFLVKNSVTYEDSLFSTCFCIMNWSCERAKRTVKVYTNFTGVVSDWKRLEDGDPHDFGCMDWTDSRRYCGDFIETEPTKTDTTFRKYNNAEETHESKTDRNFDLELIVITREARNRLFYYGNVSRHIFVTDYNEDIIGISNHWVSVSMPVTYSEEVAKKINVVPLVTIPCKSRSNSIFNRCISCEPAPVPVVVPDPVDPSPIAPNATFIAIIDKTSFSSLNADTAEDYAREYARVLRLKYPDWTGEFKIYDVKFKKDGEYEQWLKWANIYAKGKGVKDAVMVMFIDEADPFYHGIEPIVSTTPTEVGTVTPPPTDSNNFGNYTDDYNQFVDDHANYYDSFKAMVYAIPAGDSNEVPPTAINPNGYLLNNYYVNFQNHVQCAIHGEIIPLSEFIPSFQDTTNQLNIIMTENNYSTLGLGLKHFGWFEKHDFEEGFGDLTYALFSDDMDRMIDP